MFESFNDFIKNEARDFNDPLLIKMRAAQMKANKKAAEDAEKKAKELSPAKKKKIAKLKAEKEDILKQMDLEAGMMGDDWDDDMANSYGEALNDIDKEIIKLGGNPMSENATNESKIQLKRKYTENHPAITAGKFARVRNKMLEAIGDGKITQEEFESILKEFSNDSKRWSQLNKRYFSVSEDGISLSRFGKKILSKITVNENMDNMFGSFKDFINESNEVNEREFVYTRSKGFKMAADRIEQLSNQLDPNSMLCKNISSKGDNVKHEFKVMKDHMDRIYTIWQEIEYMIDMQYESVEPLCEAEVEMDAMDPDNKDFLKFLKKHRVKIIDKSMEGPGGNIPVILMQGKRKDLEAVLADCEYGWCDEELAEYIEESVDLNEAMFDVKDIKKPGLIWWYNAKGDKAQVTKMDTLSKLNFPKAKDAPEGFDISWGMGTLDQWIEKTGEKDPKVGEVYDINESATVNENKYANAGKLGYNDQFLDRRKSLSKTLSLDLGLNPKHEFGGGDWLGFDYVSLYATGGKKAGTIISDALTGKYTYDELKAAAAEFLGIKESVELNEAFKSSKLRNLMNMDHGHTSYGKKIHGLAQAFYNLTNAKLDQIRDEHLIDYPNPEKAAKEFKKDTSVVVFYIADNEKTNPYADRNSYNDLIRPGIIGLSQGSEFLGAHYAGSGKRLGKNKGKADYVTSISKESAIGGNKKYKGWEASGLYTVKRVSEVADRAIVVNLEAFKGNELDARPKVQARAEAQEGAIAFQSAEDFKKAQRKRYQDILATKASKLPLDKIVEDSINTLTKHIADAMKSGEKTKYNEIKIGEDRKGREIKITDAANIMSGILGDYERYVRYMADAEREKDSGYSSGYYEKEAKEYAKKVTDRAKKVKNMDYAW